MLTEKLFNLINAIYTILMSQYKINNSKFRYLKHNIEKVNAQSALVHWINDKVSYASFLVYKRP